MKQLDWTCEEPAANLALDEALLESAEDHSEMPEVLRLWEAYQPFVVLGRSSPVGREVNIEYCREHNIPVLRRASGGATIVTGPGCLMYAVVLDLKQRPELRLVDVAHRFVLARVQAALNDLSIDCEIQGTSDLTVGGRKFSGNSLRCRRQHLIYHGTLLYDLSPELIARCLGEPVRQPEYRQQRGHRQFLQPLVATQQQLKQALIRAWQAEEPLEDWPEELTERLVTEKYRTDAWTFKIP